MLLVKTINPFSALMIKWRKALKNLADKYLYTHILVGKQIIFKLSSINKLTGWYIVKGAQQGRVASCFWFNKPLLT